MVLPPDPHAPAQQKVHRFPPLGPALVAAAIRPDGFHTEVADLELRVGGGAMDPALSDIDGLRRHLRGASAPEVEAAVERLVHELGTIDADYVAFSLDRHTQLEIALAIARAVRLRYGTPTIMGGGGSSLAGDLTLMLGMRGLDIATWASSAPEIRAAFAALEDAPATPAPGAVVPDLAAFKGGDLRWPTPDFSVYRLEDYRYDPWSREPERFAGYRGAYGPQLVLPFRVSESCQFACAFCQAGGTQVPQDLDFAARQLGELMDRYSTDRFVLFDTQINILAAKFADALIGAGVRAKWTDSYRVTPNKPGTLERMVEAGCVGVTVGVESASDRVLKLMVKGHRQAHATRLVKQAHELGLMLRVNMLTAYPHESREDHLQSAAWLAENAFGIDDLAPSSFYLVRGSPIADDPDRHRIRIRGRREVDAEYKFRKYQQPMTYDEVGGLTWEERESTLRVQEEELRTAWLDGRGEKAVIGGLNSAMMLSMRSARVTKADAYVDVLGWMRGGRDGAPAEGETQSAPPPVAQLEQLTPIADGLATGLPEALGSGALQLVEGWELVRVGSRRDLGHAPVVEFGRGDEALWLIVTPTEPTRPAYARTGTYDVAYLNRGVAPDDEARAFLGRRPVIDAFVAWIRTWDAQALVADPRSL